MTVIHTDKEATRAQMSYLHSLALDAGYELPKSGHLWHAAAMDLQGRSKYSFTVVTRGEASELIDLLIERNAE